MLPSNQRYHLHHHAPRQLQEDQRFRHKPCTHHYHRGFQRQVGAQADQEELILHNLFRCEAGGDPRNQFLYLKKSLSKGGEDNQRNKCTICSLL